MKSKAFIQGERARSDCVHPDDNPHPTDSQDHKDWLAGWQDASMRLHISGRENDYPIKSKKGN